MKSVSKFIDGNVVAAEVRMQRQTHAGAILIVEGATDAKRFARFTDEIECLIMDGHGRPNVIDAIKLLNRRHIKGVVGVVDADFDRIECKLEPVVNIIYSEYHDLDVDYFFSGALDNYFIEVADDEKLKVENGCTGVRETVINCMQILSIVRYVNERDRMRYYLKDLNYAAFFDGNQIDQQALIDEISTGRFSNAADKQLLSEKLDECKKSSLDLKQLTNGHDICATIGVMLQNRLAKRHAVLCRSREIERGIRLAADQTVFRSLKIFNDFQQWEADNAPYVVLKYDLRTSASLLH